MTSRLIVLGATGCVGRAVVAAAAGHGLATLAIARDSDALDALRVAHAHADIATLSADLALEDGVARLVHHIDAGGYVATGVVAAIGGTTPRGRLLDAPADALRRRLDEDVLPHLSAARGLLPLLAADDHPGRRGGYVLIGGPAADCAWAGYGQRSIAAAALQMLARVLHEEARAIGVRLQLLAVDSPARTDANARHACSGWPPVSTIARHAIALAGRAGSDAGAIVRLPRDLATAYRGQDSATAESAMAPVDRIDVDIDVATSHVTVPSPPSPAQRPEHRDDADVPPSLRDARALLRAIAIAPHLKEISP